MRSQKFSPVSSKTLVLKFLLLILPFSENSSGDDPTLTKGSYTVLVEPRKYDCYFIPTFEGVALIMYFKVVRGGDRLIDFRVSNPTGTLENSIELRGDGLYSNPSTQGGYYSVCFNNHEFMATKVVLLTFETHPREEPVDKSDTYKSGDGTGELQLDAFDSTFTTIKSRIQMMFLELSVIKAFASYHKDGQDKVHFNVAFYSGLQSIIILVAGIINVILIRKLFVLPQVRK